LTFPQFLFVGFIPLRLNQHFQHFHTGYREPDGSVIGIDCQFQNFFRKRQIIDVIGRKIDGPKMHPYGTPGTRGRANGVFPDTIGSIAASRVHSNNI